MNFLMREARFEDVPQLKDLAEHFLLWNLLPDTKHIEDKIKISQDSFQHKILKEDRNFLFVLEEENKNKIIGSSQILSAFKEANDPYFLLIEEENKKYLKLEKDIQGKHQIGGLILHPEYRGTKERLGLLLSNLRFLYMSAFQQDFSKTLEVNLAGLLQGGESNAFWEEIGRKYLDENLQTVLDIYKKEGADFFSRFPKDLKIPLESLSAKAKKSFEEVPVETKPAYKALLNLGFYKTGKYHFTDGGIYLEAETQKIRFISQAQFIPFKKRNSKDESLYLLGQETKSGFFGSFIRGVLEEGVFYSVEQPSFLEEDKKVIVVHC